MSVALSLRLLEAQLEPGSTAPRELAAARAELDAALAELRELARGIHPSILTDRGLEAALSALAGRSPVPVELHSPVGAGTTIRARIPMHPLGNASRASGSNVEYAHA